MWFEMEILASFRILAYLAGGRLTIHSMSEHPTARRQVGTLLQGSPGPKLVALEKRLKSRK